MSFCGEIPFETREFLIALSDKYEKPEFLNEDPSQFLRSFSSETEAEVFSFIAAMLSFGSRKQFIPKIKEIYSLAFPSVVSWLKSGQYSVDFKRMSPDLEKKFYRFYSYSDMIVFFEEIASILKIDSFGNFFKTRTEKALLELKKSCSGEKFGEEFGEEFLEKKRLVLSSEISNYFVKSKIVPKGKNSSNKRVNMYLRWMTRKNSPVDLGLWSWWKSEDLIIPLDVHVLSEAKKLSLIPENAKPSLKTALLLTEKLKTIWKDDPCKGDFALFGLGVE